MQEPGKKRCAETEGFVYAKKLQQTSGVAAALQKKAHRWHKHYMVLVHEDESLYMYESKAASKGKVFLEDIPFASLSSVVLHPVTKKEGTRFDVHTLNGSFAFGAPDRAKAEEWAANIKSVISKANRLGGGAVLAAKAAADESATKAAAAAQQRSRRRLRRSAPSPTPLTKTTTASCARSNSRP